MSFCEGTDLVLGSRRWRLTPEPLSFRFPEGKLAALVGRNGAGKTTLLRALLGEPVVVEGRLRAPGPVAFVAQEPVYPGDVAVEDLLRLAYLPRMGLFRPPPPEAETEIADMLERLRMAPFRKRLLRELSTGERQRVFLGRAILQKPALLVLDEPTNHLDPGAVSAFWRILSGLDLNVVVSTHDLALLKRHGGWVLALDGGRKAFEGPAEAFFEERIDERLYDY